MAENTNEVKLDKKIWLSSLKTTSKIVLSLIFVFFYVISVMFVLVPKIDARIFGFFGMSNAEEICYERVYEKSGNLTDLYNLILFEQEHKNYKKELYYINVLQKDKGYAEFCKKMNLSSVLQAENKAMLVYLSDVNAYLASRKVKCLYALGLTATTTVLASLKSDNLTEYVFASYVETIKESNLSDEQKLENYNELLETFELGDGDKSVAELLDEKLAKIQARLIVVEDENSNEELLLTYSLMKHSYAAYEVYKVKGTAYLSQATIYKEIYESAAERYNNIIK